MRKLRSQHLAQARSEVESLLDDNAHLAKCVAHLQAAAQQLPPRNMTKNHGASGSTARALALKCCDAKMRQGLGVKPNAQAASRPDEVM